MGKLDYRGLAVLDAVCTSGSFEKAALALGISQSAVSQRIKALEDATGRLLVVRGTPSVATGLGQRLVVHHRHVKLMEAALDIDLGRTVSLPDLSIAVDSDSLFRISMRLYGSPRMTDAFYEMNRAAIGANPDRLRLGMILRLPAVPDGK